MKRIEFIIQLISLTGLKWLIPASLKKPARKGYTLYEGWIAGYVYYSGPDIEDSLRVGQAVELHREPENKHDEKAIELYAGGYKLGYISRVDNSILAQLMDQGAAIEAEIAAVVPGTPQWERVNVRVKTSEFF